MDSSTVSPWGGRQVGWAPPTEPQNLAAGSARPTAGARRRGSGPRASGFVLVVVIMCLGAAVAILGSFAATAVSGRESLRAECRQLQAQWLVESAVERAAALLAVDANYSGEQWAVTAAQLNAADGGVVTIRVDRLEGRPNVRQVYVQASYPDQATYRCLQTKQVTIEVPRPAKPSAEERLPSQARFKNGDRHLAKTYLPGSYGSLARSQSPFLNRAPSQGEQ